MDTLESIWQWFAGLTVVALAVVFFVLTSSLAGDVIDYAIKLLGTLGA